ncbi:MAG: haloacid dehalogenase-like hydrolase [Deltaproteobacteria bacterium]|nr:haloacid dehalogenase-like hydrolase [Deltaproteobacteria bacterium]
MSNKATLMKTLSALLCLSSTLAACGDDLGTDAELTAIGESAHAAPASFPGNPTWCRPTSLTSPWHGTNQATLTTWIDSLGCTSADFRPNQRPLAVFDWDNTIVKNDVGDAITFHLIKHDKVLQPPGQDWRTTNRFMTADAAAALTVACGTDVPAGQPLPTSSNLGCADEMLSMYVDGKTRAGVAAFAGWNFRRMEPTYAWTVQLLAGYTPEEVQSMARAAVLPMLEVPIGATQVVGTRTLNGFIRFYDQIRELIEAMQTRGFDVWVSTASPQDVVAALAPLAGIPAHKVVGVRSVLDAGGRLTYDFQGCGPVADGENTMMSYIEGKRCWINKVIYGDTTANAINQRPEGDRQVFGAGDSDTDIEFLRDTSYRLVINRAKKELMCFGYHNEDGNWIVNPMFIQPRSMQATPFPCATNACKDAGGTGQACIDDGGDVIPDQLDSVHP